MNCDRCRSAMRDYLDEELDESSSREFEGHVDDCVACATEFETVVETRLRATPLASIREALHELDPTESPRLFDDRPADQTRNLTPMRRAWWAAIPAAAAVVFFLFATGEEVASADEVLAHLRRGPRADGPLRYRQVDAKGIEHEFLFDLDGRRAGRSRRGDRDLETWATGGAIAWTFDHTGDRLRLREPGRHPATTLDLANGAAVAAWLEKNFEVDCEGETRVDGAPCWILGGRSKAKVDGIPAEIRLFVDKSRRIIRKRVDTLAEGDHFVLELAKAAPLPFDFDPTRFVTSTTIFDIGWEQMAVEGETLTELLTALRTAGGSGLQPFDVSAPEMRPLMEIIDHIARKMDLPISPFGAVGSNVIVGVDGDIPEVLKVILSPSVFEKAKSSKDVIHAVAASCGLEVDMPETTSPTNTGFIMPTPMPAFIALECACRLPGWTWSVSGKTLVIRTSGGK